MNDISFNFSDPAFIQLLSTIALSVGASLIVAGIIATSSGRLLDLSPGHKLWVFIVGFAFLCSLSTLPLTEHETLLNSFYIAVIPLLVVFLYFLPTAAAINGHNPNFNSIFIMNLFFGWTLAGWVVALFWAFRRPAAIEGANFRVTPFGAVPNKPPPTQH